MGDNALQVQDQPKEKKKRKSTVKKSDLPKEKPDAISDNSEVTAETTDAPKEKPASRKQSAAAAPAEAVDATPEGGSRKTSVAVPSEAQNGDEIPEVAIQNETSEVPVVAEVTTTPETPVRRESAIAQKKHKKEMNMLQELDEEKLIELKECFELFDLNQDGFIDLADLKLTFATLGRGDVSDEELKSMLAEASNPMDFDAFVMLLGFKTIALDPEETLREALASWDYRDSGLISEERIKHDLMTWGDKFDQEEAEGAFEDAPTFMTNGQRMIDYIKFCKTLGGLRKKT